MALVPAKFGKCEDNTLDLSISVREKYSDNIFLSRLEKTEDFSTTMIPSLQWKRDSKRMNTLLSATLESIFYNQNDVLNQTDQFYNGSLQYLMTDRLTTSFDAAFTRDSRWDRDLETTGLVLTNVVRKRQSYQFNEKYLLSEKNIVYLDYSFSQDVFEKGTYDDFRSQQLGFQFSRALTPDTNMQIQLGYAHYDYPLVDVDNYSLTLGAGSRLSETVTGSVNIGGRYTKSAFTLFRMVFDPELFQIRQESFVMENDDTGIVGEIEVACSGEFTNYRLSFQHDIQAGSGRSGTSQKTGVILEMGHRFTENLSGSLNSGFYLNRANESESSTGKIDERSLWAETQFRYRIGDHFILNAAYRYTRVNDNLNGTTTYANTVWISLAMDFDINS